MKIWCCLCFTEEEEEVKQKSSSNPSSSMEGAGIFENDVNFGDISGSDGEDEEDALEDMRLHFLMRRCDREERTRAFDALARELCAGPDWEDDEVGDVDPSTWMPITHTSFRIVDGEGSSSSAADSHHKRAKIHSDSLACQYAIEMSSNGSNSTSLAERERNISQGSSVPSNNAIFYHNFLSNNNGDENLLDAGGGKDNGGDGGGTPNSEDGSDVQMDLTDDLLHKVFSFLDQMDLCSAALVCRQWRAASAHEDFWRCLDFRDLNISLEQFQDMCHRYPNATEVNIFGAPAIHKLVMEAVASLRNIEALTLGRGQLGDNFFNVLGDCHMLKSLDVNDAILGNGIQEISINHDRLCHLGLTKCRVLRISVRCLQLETLSLKRSNMAHAVLNCPLLHDLDIGSCHKLSDTAIRSAATSCPQLESLDMSNCSSVTDETLREIAVACSNLHILNASYCPNISLESVRLPMLTVLKLHSCEGITSVSMAAISHSNMLEVLELVNCGLLNSVRLVLPRLQKIRLVHCRKFLDLNLCCVGLSSITVSNCPVLRRINVISNSLQKLALQKQESLTTLALQCQSLQDVDLTDCASLTNSICEVFNDRVGCPMLKSLVLDNCGSLTAVGFSSSSLVSLSLVGCQDITSLDLKCPYLEQVYLDGCNRLERASFFPVGLRSLNLGICPKLNVLNIEAPLMSSLELKGCGVLSEASINCPLLKSLDASFCSQLKDDCLCATAASCPLIESLILMSCSSVGSDGLYSLHCLPCLTILDLSYTCLLNLQPVFEFCLQLKVLKLQACKNLTDSSLEPLYKEGALPALHELDLSYGTLCQSAIEELLTCCTHLTHVSLNGCVNMHDLNWGCKIPSVCSSSDVFSHGNINEPFELPNRLLQNLNCVGCPNIRNIFIPPTAHYFHLSSLNLSLSANLKEVDVSCFNLCFLNLSNCCSLEILKLECPKLTSLFLQSCYVDEETVEVAISKCCMLETLDVRFCSKIFSMSMGRRLRTACPSLKRVFSSLSPT